MTRHINPELEPHVPDWINELSSDYLLAKALKEKLDKPFWRRSLQDWRERRKIKAMLRDLREHGFYVRGE